MNNILQKLNNTHKILIVLSLLLAFIIGYKFFGTKNSKYPTIKKIKFQRKKLHTAQKKLRRLMAKHKDAELSTKNLKIITENYFWIIKKRSDGANEIVRELRKRVKQAKITSSYQISPATRLIKLPVADYPNIKQGNISIRISKCTIGEINNLFAAIEANHRKFFWTRCDILPLRDNVHVSLRATLCAYIVSDKANKLLTKGR